MVSYPDTSISPSPAQDYPSRLQDALTRLKNCRHYPLSKYGSIDPQKIPRKLKFAIENRDRYIDLNTSPGEDGTYPTNVLTSISGFCPEFKEVVDAFLEWKQGWLVYAGPLCGYIEANYTVFVLDLNPAINTALKDLLSSLHKEFSQRSEIYSWSCLGNSPVQWWFKNIWFRDNKALDWQALRRIWKDPDFQACVKTVEIKIDRKLFDLLEQPMVFLDMVFSYLGPMEYIRELHIKTIFVPGSRVSRLHKEEAELAKVLDEQNNTDRGLESELRQSSEAPVMDVWAWVWKWQGMCPPWNEDLKEISECDCCPNRRPQIRLWNYAKSKKKHYHLELEDYLGGLHYVFVNFTCLDREYRNSIVRNVANRWPTDWRLKSGRIDEMITCFGEFLDYLDQHGEAKPEAEPSSSPKQSMAIRTRSVPVTPTATPRSERKRDAMEAELPADWKDVVKRQYPIPQLDGEDRILIRIKEKPLETEGTGLVTPNSESKNRLSHKLRPAYAAIKRSDTEAYGEFRKHPGWQEKEFEEPERL